MTEELEVLHIVTHRLTMAQVPYMVTGSMAMNFYAMPRMTRDMIMSRSGSERLTMGCSMYSTAKKIARASILDTDPQTTEKALRSKLFLRFYADNFDPETQKKFFKH